MDTQIKNLVEECSKGSEEGSITFPQVVMKLMEVGVERYSVDFMRHEKIFYMPDGDAYQVSSAKADEIPAQEFVAAGIEAAVRASQAGQIDYREFCKRVLKAGCSFMSFH